MWKKIKRMTSPFAFLYNRRIFILYAWMLPFLLAGLWYSYCMYSSCFFTSFKKLLPKIELEELQVSDLQSADEYCNMILEDMEAYMKTVEWVIFAA